MLDIVGNRGVLALIGVLSALVILYNVWGPFLIITGSLVVVLHVIYSLQVNDTVISPKARQLLLLLLRHLGNSAVELKILAGQLFQISRQWTRERVMSFRRQGTYQLSADFPGNQDQNVNATAALPDHLGNLTTQLSPIQPSRNFHRENNDTCVGNSLAKVTSTPLSWRRESPRENGDLNASSSSTGSRGKREERNMACYTPEDSPWNSSASPKLRNKVGGVRTVQTVAGPLLASTRYNIDPKTFSDVTSPGLTTRLTKYATEANNKLLQQSYYGLGQFPKVNLNASPTPVITSRVTKTRMPVTVRVAPPETLKYTPSERSMVLSEICHADSKPCPSVVQVLREISLKRHASREDLAAELVKKQRMEEIYCETLENLEEMTQKRGRDESPKSEEEMSPNSRGLRPSKRTKTPSCYDIINSLSSSTNQIATSSGTKRKATDLARNGTPDAGKHFKALETSPTLQLPERIVQAATSKRDLNEVRNDEHDSLKRFQEEPLPSTKSALNAMPPINYGKFRGNGRIINEKTEEIVEKTPFTSSQNEKLVDKLFMRAQPQKNEKLRNLIEEQDKVKVKFTSDSSEQIKKEDIVKMRATSMKARLKSMFDAVSGKASEINPALVIQAGDVTDTPTSSAPPASLATLNSTTTTTHVNTSPISTSTIITPILNSGKPKDSTEKHVSFKLTSQEESAKPKETLVVSEQTIVQSAKVPENTSKPAEPPKFGIATTTPTSTTSNFMAKTTTDSPKSVTSTSNLTFGVPNATASQSNSNSTATIVKSSPLNIPTVPKLTFGVQTSPLTSQSAAPPLAPATQSQPSLAITSSAPPAFGFNNNSSSLAKSTSVVSSSADKPTFSFGQTAATTQKTEGFSFTAPKPATTATSSFASATNFSFTPATTSSVPATSSTFSFGNTPATTSSVSSGFQMPSAPPTTNASGFSMPTATTAPPAFSMLTATSPSTTSTSSLFSNSTTSKPMFGGTLTAASAVNPATSNPAIPSYGAVKSVFGSGQTSGFSAPAATSDNKLTTFAGANNNQSTLASTSAPGIFSGVKTTLTGSPFGNNATTASSTSDSTTNFAAVKPFNANTSFGGGASIFGSQNATNSFGTGSAASTVGGFGSTPANTATIGASSSFIAPNTTSSLPSFASAISTTSSSTFNFSGGQQSNNQTTAFGGSKTSAPTIAFGSGTTTSSAIFGTSNQQTTSAASTFGGPVSSMFGGQEVSNAAQQSQQQQGSTLPSFASTTSFGSATSPSMFAPKTTSSANIFNSPSSTTASFGNATSPFNAQANNNNAAAPSFGGSATGSSTFGQNLAGSNNSFGFNATQKQEANNQQPFAFGSQTTTSAGATPFQFGSPKPATGGFNFSASTNPTTSFTGGAAVPSFNAGSSGSFAAPQTGGMFSIGSGNTAPRSRTSRTRRAK